MEKAKDFMARFLGLAGFYGDKTLLAEQGLRVTDLQLVCGRFGYEVFDCEAGFVVAQRRFC